MSEKPEQASEDGDVQVFELTMDNSENQEELNRRLRKPGEPELSSIPNNGRTTYSGQVADTGEKKKGT